MRNPEFTKKLRARVEALEAARAADLKAAYLAGFLQGAADPGHPTPQGGTLLQRGQDWSERYWEAAQWFDA